jgi:hypothetical protein
MPPSTFVRDGSQGGFASALQQIFGALSNGAYGFRAYQKYGPGYQQELDKQDLARQEAEIALKQHQANLDYEPIKAAQGRLGLASGRLTTTKMLEQMVADALQGQEGQTEATPLPQQGVFDTQLPPGTGPLAEGYKAKEAVPPQLNPADVEASGTPLESIIAGGKGLQSQNKLALAIQRAQQQRDHDMLLEGGRNNRQGTGIRAKLDLQTMLETGRNARAQTSQSGIESRFGRSERRLGDQFRESQDRLAANDEQRTLDTIDRMDQATLNSRSRLLQGELRNLDPNDDNYDTDRAKLIGAMRAIDAKLAAPRAPRPPRAPAAGGGAPAQNAPVAAAPHPARARVGGQLVPWEQAPPEVHAAWDRLSPEQQRQILAGGQ